MINVTVNQRKKINTIYNRIGNIMPNRKAKRRKSERQEKNRYLNKYGRTPAQIKKKEVRAKKKLNRTPQ
jgi:hypothetical protein